MENEATRGKLERLRMVMEQSRARRRARREGKPDWSPVDASNVCIKIQIDFFLKFVFVF